MPTTAPEIRVASQDYSGVYCPTCLVDHGLDDAPEPEEATFGIPSEYVIQDLPFYDQKTPLRTVGWYCAAHDTHLVMQHKDIACLRGDPFTSGGWVGALIETDDGREIYTPVPIGQLRGMSSGGVA